MIRVYDYEDIATIPPLSSPNFSRATITAAVRVCTPSFLWICSRCFRTVPLLQPSTLMIAALLLSLAIQKSTSASRLVSPNYHTVLGWFRKMSDRVLPSNLRFHSWTFHVALVNWVDNDRSFPPFKICDRILVKSIFLMEFHLLFDSGDRVFLQPAITSK